MAQTQEDVTRPEAPEPETPNLDETGEEGGKTTQERDEEIPPGA